MPLTCVVIAGVIADPAYRIAWRLAEQEQARTDYYLSIRVEDIAPDAISKHLQKIERRFMGAWAGPEIRRAVFEFPDGILFFYNSSDEQWRNLGGEAGYAILLNGRIVWKLRLAIS